MAGRKGSQTGRCEGRNHPERVRIERFLAAGASIKGAARKFAINYHALRRHWRNHVSQREYAIGCLRSQNSPAETRALARNAPPVCITRRGAKFWSGH